MHLVEVEDYLDLAACLRLRPGRRCRSGPMLAGVLVVVAITMTISALKVFDLVYVMTFGNYDTDVIANRHR